MKTVFAASGALAAFMLSLSVSAGAQNFYAAVPCGDAVPDKLAALGVKPDSISQSMTEEEWGSHRSAINEDKDVDVFRGYTVWMDMKSCKGRVVMRLSPTCVVRTVYTTGACRIPGVGNW